MDCKEFWKIIEETKPKKDNDFNSQKSKFHIELEKYSDDDLKKAQAFLNKYYEMLDEVINIWELAYKYEIGDHHYWDFKRWVISKGFDLYKTIYKGNLDVIKNYITIKNGITYGVEFEGFSFMDRISENCYKHDSDYFGYERLHGGDITEIEFSLR